MPKFAHIWPQTHIHSSELNLLCIRI